MELGRPTADPRHRSHFAACGEHVVDEELEVLQQMLAAKQKPPLSDHA